MTPLFWAFAIMASLTFLVACNERRKSMEKSVEEMRIEVTSDIPILEQGMDLAPGQKARTPTMTARWSELSEVTPTNSPICNK